MEILLRKHVRKLNESKGVWGWVLGFWVYVRGAAGAAAFHSSRIELAISDKRQSILCYNHRRLPTSSSWPSAAI